MRVSFHHTTPSIHRLQVVELIAQESAGRRRQYCVFLEPREWPLAGVQCDGRPSQLLPVFAEARGRDVSLILAPCPSPAWTWSNVAPTRSRERVRAPPPPPALATRPHDRDIRRIQSPTTVAELQSANCHHPDLDLLSSAHWLPAILTSCLSDPWSWPFISLSHRPADEH